MAGPGGRIAPDGRPAVAPGVGKNARRHDLEAPATPGLSNSDLQQGDVQRLEQAQKIAPRPKKNQSAASPRTAPKRAAPPNSSGMQIPDPIQFAAGKVGGGIPRPESQPQELFDVEKWRPLMSAIVRNPLASGPLTTTLMQQLANLSRQVNTSAVEVIDQNGAEAAIRESIR